MKEVGVMEIIGFWDVSCKGRLVKHWRMIILLMEEILHHLRCIKLCK